MLNKLVLIGLFCLVLGAASAQNPKSYFGVGAAHVFGASLLPTLSLQIGTEVAESLEIRATVDTLAIVNIVGGDILYTLQPSDDLKFYFGGGPDYLLVIPTTGSAFDIHATAGLEYQLNDLEGVRLYAEVKPFVLSIASGTPAVQLRAGVNFLF